MVKELCINEKLFVSLHNDKIRTILIGEQYKRVEPKELQSKSYNFIKRYPRIMESLQKGSVIESTRDKDTIKSVLEVTEIQNELTKEEKLKVISEAVGYSMEESIENLEYSLHKSQKTKGKK